MAFNPRDYALQALQTAEKERLIAVGKSHAYQDMANRLDPGLFCQDCGKEYDPCNRENHEAECEERRDRRVKKNI